MSSLIGESGSPFSSQPTAVKIVYTCARAWDEHGPWGRPSGHTDGSGRHLRLLKASRDGQGE